MGKPSRQPPRWPPVSGLAEAFFSRFFRSVVSMMYPFNSSSSPLLEYDPITFASTVTVLLSKVFQIGFEKTEGFSRCVSAARKAPGLLHPGKDRLYWAPRMIDFVLYPNICLKASLHMRIAPSPAAIKSPDRSSSKSFLKRSSLYWSCFLEPVAVQGHLYRYLQFLLLERFL